MLSSAIRRFAATVPIEYVQGQYHGKKREYFYYINHEGMLFLDDSRMKNFTAAYKDVDFLNFFYKHLKVNDTERFPVEFPYWSRCGREMNLLRCDDRPIVYTKVLNDGTSFQIGDSKLQVPLDPTKLFMLENGRLYHPSHFASYGLVKSILADTVFFPCFVFDSDGYPKQIRWKGQLLDLVNGRGLS